MWIIIVGSLLSLISIITSVFSISCYCTERNRCELGTCESEWCLVGVKATETVVRTCANENVRHLLNVNNCRQQIDDWLEVCSCDSSLCNTLGYLRYKMKEKQLDESFIPSSPFVRSASRNIFNELFDKSSDTSNAVDERQIVVAAAPVDEPPPETLELEPTNRQLYPPNSVIISRPELTDRAKFSGKGNKPVKESHLLLVLIIVPLSVGATAVCVIVVNYYCKLC